MVCSMCIAVTVYFHCSHQVLVPHIALPLSQSQDHATLSAVHKLIETFVKQANNKNGNRLSVSYMTGEKLVASYIVIVASHTYVRITKGHKYEICKFCVLFH